LNIEIAGEVRRVPFFLGDSERLHCPAAAAMLVLEASGNNRAPASSWPRTGNPTTSPTG